MRVLNLLLNPLDIIKHVRPRLEELSLTSPTDEKMTRVVQKSFTDLELKLHDGLDVVHPWGESESVEINEMLIRPLRDRRYQIQSDGSIARM